MKNASVKAASGPYLKNGLGVEYLNDTMAIIRVETELLREQVQALLLRALAAKEKTEMIRERWGVYKCVI